MNAGKYNKPISFYSVTIQKDSAGYQQKGLSNVLNCKAEIKTLKGITMIQYGTDFSKKYVRFMIRKPRVTEITKDLMIFYGGVYHSIEYINDLDTELEIQALEVGKQWQSLSL